MIRKTATILAATAALGVAAADDFAFADGDRVALVGNTVIERAQQFGHLETMLTLAAGPETEVPVFRNLGWSGDSVFADARSYFGKPTEGRQRLEKLVGELKPTVLVTCYGTGAAMSVETGWTLEPGARETSAAGEAESLTLFIENYGKLLDLLEKSAGDSLRETVLVAPPPLENLGEPYPDQAANNARLRKFRDAIRDLAKDRGARFVDLFEAMGGEKLQAGEPTESPLTTNGVHYGDAGYALMARELVQGLGLNLPTGLAPDDPALAELRAAVIKKNRLFFHRWRPVNETYLFLFRKHEQGQNAKEIPQFDPLIEAEENRIKALRTGVMGTLKRN